MPRVCTLSCCSTTWPILCRPSAATVAFCFSSALMVLLTNLIFIVPIVASSAQNFLDGLATQLRDLFNGAELCKACDGGPNHVGRIIRSDGFRRDVMDSRKLKHGTNGTTGNNAGSFDSRTKQNVSCAEKTDALVWNGGSGRRNLDEILLRVFDTFADGIRNFGCFAGSDPHMAIFVTDNDKCRETEITAAFDNFCHTAD